MGFVQIVHNFWLGYFKCSVFLETFFVISGFLTFYLITQQLTTKKRLNFIPIMIYRWLRCILYFNVFISIDDVKNVTICFFPQNFSGLCNSHSNVHFYTSISKWWSLLENDYIQRIGKMPKKLVDKCIIHQQLCQHRWTGKKTFTNTRVSHRNLTNLIIFNFLNILRFFLK